MTFSRRGFLGLLSTAMTWVLAKPALQRFGDRSDSTFEEERSLWFSGQRWHRFGRVNLRGLSSSGLTIQDGYVMAETSMEDYEFSFEARAPHDVEQTQIWAGIRCLDRNRRYVFALRGGANQDLYLARYGPDGQALFLGVAPVDFLPIPGEWYKLRAVAFDKRFMLFVGDETRPRIDVVDFDASWTGGGIALGGGWVRTEYRNISANALTQTQRAMLEKLTTVPSVPTGSDKTLRRIDNRKRYLPQMIDRLDMPRAEVALNGQWLFMPDWEVPAGAEPQSESCSDDDWHVMDVPAFWTPTEAWLYGETSFTHLQGVSITKGISDKFYRNELRRLDDLTFDWRRTKAAWYRHYFTLSSPVEKRRIELHFDAIAKVSEVWVNGLRVGSHTGMFGELRCDISTAIRPGENLIAVHVVGQPDNAASSQVVGVAVTVEVTAAMLNSMPHGMFVAEASGIWQPVTLVSTPQTYIGDVYIKPRLSRLSADVTVFGKRSQSGSYSLSFSITSAKDGSELYAQTDGAAFSLEAPERILSLSTPELKPLLWSPAEPNLYELHLVLSSGEQVIDRVTTRFGFRTFEVAGEKLLLNGKAFWMRGANHFPNALRPNDGKLARTFMRLAKEGNVVATRSHAVPFTTTWLDAADEVGIGVSYEGTWPWLMLEGDLPAASLLKEWESEFLTLLRKHRNHPSILFWTVNNEMKFPVLDKNNPNQLLRKWTVVTNAVTAMRALDPTRPIVCDSSYCRKEIGEEYEHLVVPNRFDDGDIDDAHRYYGWYNETFFHHFQGQFGKSLSTPGRPLISQEMSTGYPRNDDGHPTRFYLFQHQTPQSLVGDEAYENRDPAIFLKRQSFMTKELAETIRRTNRHECSGVLHFAYISWFRDVWDVASIKPFETYFALKTALQPVLISAELYGRHHYAGATLEMRVCIVNDDSHSHDIPAGRIRWSIESAGITLSEGSQPSDPVPYYSNDWQTLHIAMPSGLSSKRLDASLRLVLETGQDVRSVNSYDIVLAEPIWTGPEHVRLAVLSTTASHFAAKLGASVRAISALHDADATEILLIPDAEVWLGAPRAAEDLLRYLNGGGRILLLHAGQELAKLFPGSIRDFRKCPGEIVSMHIPEATAFDELLPLDLAWFHLGSGTVPRACRGVYTVDQEDGQLTMLATVVDIHGYLKKPSELETIRGTPLVSITSGKGVLIASEMFLLEAIGDPIADRLYKNLIRALNDDQTAPPDRSLSCA